MLTEPLNGTVGKMKLRIPIIYFGCVKAGFVSIGVGHDLKCSWWIDCICLMGVIGNFLFLIALPEKQRWCLSITNIVIGCKRMWYFNATFDSSSCILYRESLGSYIITECWLLCDQLYAVSTHGGVEKDVIQSLFRSIEQSIGMKESDEGV